MTTLNSTIQVRRGTAAQMPTVLLVGELYFQTDTSKLYAGTGTGVVQVSSGGGAVASVFGRTGFVVADAGDYGAVDNVLVEDTGGQGLSVDTADGRIILTGGTQATLQLGPDGSGIDINIKGTDIVQANDTFVIIQNNNDSDIILDGSTGNVHIDSSGITRMGADAGILVGANTTGGAQGSSTINAAGLFIEGVAVKHHRNNGCGCSC